MSTKEICPKCGATTPVVQNGICGGCSPEAAGKIVELTPPYGKESLPHYHPMNNPEAFIADWDRMIGTIGDFAAKYNLPVPEMIIHPKIHMMMNAVAQERILGTLIHRGVRVRTGVFELATMFREL